MHILICNEYMQTIKISGTSVALKSLSQNNLQMLYKNNEFTKWDRRTFSESVVFFPYHNPRHSDWIWG